MYKKPKALRANESRTDWFGLVFILAVVTIEVIATVLLLFLILVKATNNQPPVINNTEAQTEWMWPISRNQGRVRGVNEGLGGGCWKNPRPYYQHTGLDIYAPKGAPVFASKAGIVASIDTPLDTDGYGHYIIVDSKDGKYELYGHIETSLVSIGQTIKQNQQIATVGNSGNAKEIGYQLHFQIQTMLTNSLEIDINQTINPLDLLPNDGRNLNGCKSGTEGH